MLCTLVLVAAQAAGGAPREPLALRPIGRYDTGLRDASAAEILAHDPDSQRLYVTSGGEPLVFALDIRDPSVPVLVQRVVLSSFGSGVQSVAVSGGLVAVAVAAHTRTDPGQVVLLDTGGDLLGRVRVGALPDMLTFDAAGGRLLVANEGEPSDDDTVDPEGSVSIIDLPDDPARLGPGHVRTVDFRAFDAAPPPGVRVLAPGALLSRCLEPEFIALDPEGHTAWVVLQENNAVARVDVDAARVSALLPLGSRTLRGATGGADLLGLDAPDGIAAFRIGGADYFVTANEGDDSERAARDPSVTFASQSVSVRGGDGGLVWDSGTLLGERVCAARGHAAAGGACTRCPREGPGPEGLVLGALGERTLVFVGLERASALAALDVSRPAAPRLEALWCASAGAGGALTDEGPEGLAFVAAEHSPTGRALLAVAFEVSGSVVLFDLVARR